MAAQQGLKIPQCLKRQLDANVAQLASMIEEHLESQQQALDAAHARMEELEAKLKLQTEAETDARIRELAARDQISVEAWLTREIKNAAAFADAPFIRVQAVFYERLKAHARAKGVLPEALTTTTETTQRLMSLLDNLLI